MSKKKNLIRKFIKLVKNKKPEVYYYLKDNYEILIGQRDKLTPPERMNFVGDGDFKQIGEDFLKYFIEIGGLKPTDSVLDVGCGIGRMAIPLTKYLSKKEGSYDGFDIVKLGIDWCNNKITPKYPNFNFLYAEIYNKRYNQDAKTISCEYNFPYKDSSFDFIFLTSVFTHMLPVDMENYLKEITRVLKKGGKCFITYFMLNEESLNCIDKNISNFSFKFKSGDCHFDSEEMPESAISYDEKYIRDLYQKYQLIINEPILFGSWCGRAKYLSFQDIVLAVKE